MEQVICLTNKARKRGEMYFHEYIEWLFDLEKQEAMLYYMSKHLQSLREANYTSSVLWHTQYLTDNLQKTFADDYRLDREMTLNAIISQRNWIATLKRLNDGKELCYAD